MGSDGGFTEKISKRKNERAYTDNIFFFLLSEHKVISTLLKQLNLMLLMSGTACFTEKKKTAFLEK